MRRGIAFLSALLAALAVGATHPQAVPSGSGANSLLIAGGTVVDGTGAHRRRADVRVEGDHIAAVGRLTPHPGETVLDARGLVVAPGFIDAHSHADGGLLEMPLAETQIRQGITTSVVGQDGSSHFPLASYFDQLEAKHVALNIASFVGHGTVRGQVMGKDYKRPSTPEETAKMAALVEQEMHSGALGLSSGLEYEPGRFGTTEEIIACAKAAGAQGGLYISHMRNEDNAMLTALQELLRIGAEGHLPAQVSHIKLGSARVWGKAGEVLNMMADARKRGQDVSADVYPYLYWQSTIRVLIPTQDYDNRDLWKQGLSDVGGPGHVLLSHYGPDPSWAGKTIAEIAAMTNQDPITVIQTVIKNTSGPNAKGGEGVIVTAMSEDDLRRFIADPHIMFCSDGGILGTHPRHAGSFPRLLGVYVRQQHVLTLEACIHKMTELAAHRMGFRNRGTIQPGMKADIVLFDPDTVSDTATVASPNSPPVGLPTVLVNGIPVLEDGKMTGNRPGEVLRRQSK